MEQEKADEVMPSILSSHRWIAVITTHWTISISSLVAARTDVGEGLFANSRVARRLIFKGDPSVPNQSLEASITMLGEAASSVQHRLRLPGQRDAGQSLESVYQQVNEGQRGCRE